MKVGILTFHRAHNFGAMLQCYALQEYLTTKGLNVEVIDYRQPYIETLYSKYSLQDLEKHNLKRFIKGLFILTRYTRNRRCSTFNKFAKRFIKTSSKEYTNSIFGYDCIIIGSDQLWNRNLTNGIDYIYFGDFEHEPTTNVFAYSVSLGHKEFNKTDFEYALFCINTKLNYVSVRETQLKNYLSDICNKDILVTLDPTLLLNKEDWLKISCNIRYKKYVLIYPLIDIEETINAGIQLAKSKGLNYYIIDGVAKWFPIKHHLRFVNPSEFISLIFNANYIVTSSFHGTVFSIILNKEFFSFVKSDTHNYRIESLLSNVDLSKRLINEYSHFSSVDTPIHYEKVNRIIHNLRMESEVYLQDSINRL